MKRWSCDYFIYDTIKLACYSLRTTIHIAYMSTQTFVGHAHLCLFTFSLWCGILPWKHQHWVKRTVRLVLFTFLKFIIYYLVRRNVNEMFENSCDKSVIIIVCRMTTFIFFIQFKMLLLREVGLERDCK